MTPPSRLPPALRAAVAEVDRAVFEYDGARAWPRAPRDFAEPLAVEVWVFDRPMHQVLLVRHRWRGWVPPGGAADPGEGLRRAALRELLEETGLRTELFPRPAAVAVRSFRHDWPATLALSYAATVDPEATTSPEDGQPVDWKPLDEPWASVFPEDRLRMLAYVSAARGRD
jgi:8-oxo-dGTP diphosphatase